jgi:hypothetical protein
MTERLIKNCNDPNMASPPEPTEGVPADHFEIEWDGIHVACPCCDGAGTRECDGVLPIRNIEDLKQYAREFKE